MPVALSITLHIVLGLNPILGKQGLGVWLISAWVYTWYMWNKRVFFLLYYEIIEYWDNISLKLKVD